MFESIKLSNIVFTFERENQFKIENKLYRKYNLFY